MAETLPYIVNPGTIATALNKMMQAECPSKFTQSFLKETLGLKSGGAQALTPFFRHLGILDQSNTPTEIYRKFKNPHASKTAIAEAIRIGYKPIFKRNESAHTLSSDQLKGLVLEILGDDKNSARVSFVVRCFNNLLSFADFTSLSPLKEDKAREETEEELTVPIGKSNKYGVNFGYTINLNLPETKDPAVYSAIFKSLKEYLLTE